ncbi:MAG: tetratricopeptide repeat protein [Deltaproteobacteria bacterium]|nr:tetratricopeptide repeat protein [Deltaproteobacteria bacterium]
MNGLRGKKIPYPALLAALLTFLAYLPSLQNGFVNWDDGLYVVENLNIRHLDLEFLKWAFTNTYLSNWHPLTLISYALDYRIGGLNPFIYHLENIVFHALNTFLVSVLTVRLLDLIALEERKDAEPGQGVSNTLAFTAPLVAALLFGLHPLHVESVTWVSERKDVLSVFFFLLSVLAYLRYSTGPAAKKVSYYLASLFFFILALLCKPMVMTLPVVLLMLDYYPLGRISGLRHRLRDLKRELMEKVPFAALSAASALISVWAQEKGGSLASSDSIPFLMRAVMAVRSYAFYLYKTFLPVNLAPFYPYPEKVTLFDIQYAGSFALLIAITLACLFAARRYRFLIVAWVYYLVTLVPVIGLIQVGSQSSADRYMYLPSLGLFILAGILTGHLLQSLRSRPSGAGKAASLKKPGFALVTALAVTVILTLSFLTVRQERVWKDPITFWTYETKVYPMEYTAYYYRGLYYKQLNEEENAIADYRKAISLNPQPAGIYNAIGILYGDSGRYGDAIEAFNNALKMNPGFDRAYNNRGYTYFKAGDYRKAVEDIKKAIELDPGNTGAYYNIASAYRELGETEQARINIEIADKLKSKAR